MHAINQVILSLYREGRHIPLRSFHDWALEQVRNVIAFDSAWWGNAAAEPMKVHWAHLHNCDASILQAYTPYMAQDFFRAALMARPGVTINMADLITRERFVHTELYRNVGKRYRVEWSLGTLLIDPTSALHEFLTLWRHDPERPFSEPERQTKELLMPHLAETLRSVRLRHFLSERDLGGKTWALADDHGYIREAAPAFVACLREHWPNWRGGLLPAALAKCAIEARSYEAKSLTIVVALSSELRFLEVQEKSILDKLTKRESEIVGRYASGETYSEIALAIGLSPATVRNHVSRSFKKLAVRNKVQLAGLLASKRRL